MSTLTATQPTLPGRVAGLLPGLAIVTGIAVTAMALDRIPGIGSSGIGVLTVAIALGMLVSQFASARIHDRAAPGAAFSQRTLLRTGVALYGLRLTLHDIAAAGLHGIAVDVIMISAVLGTAWFVGTRLLKLDRDTALLVGMGSAVCGAAAVMATEPVLRAPPYKVAIAVATVTVFGSCAVFLYPALFPLLGLDPQQYGMFVGSTVHEVAQVVAAGKAVSASAGDEAVIVKLLRVAMLAPILIIIGRLVARTDKDETPGKSSAPIVPGFVIAFAGLVLLHSLGWLPAAAHAALLQLDGVLLALAMAALGWSARISMMKAAGPRPLVLGAVLFGVLTIGGYALNCALNLLPF
ncbi:YeiH family protein [Solimonas marina]|uniref:YeiH family putative sulfate export transporter n=1 Tax=Solimonas marina TaxID=2714601 RepID=A0A970B4Y2_9GAMM|nr:YeiH family protein [Solimonas marina]NKF22807.1 YeiH family putative sulfate export transporter [Solimonas marina]